jgi:hypothetical protein
MSKRITEHRKRIHEYREKKVGMSIKKDYLMQLNFVEEKKVL